MLYTRFTLVRLPRGFSCAALAGCLVGCAGQSGMSNPAPPPAPAGLAHIRFVYAKITTPEDPNVAGSLRMGLFLHDSPGMGEHPLPRSDEESRPYGPVIAGPVTLSPDGRQVAFVANVPGEIADMDALIGARVLGTQVWVHNIASGSVQRLSHDFSSLPKPITPGSIVTPAIAYHDVSWSPDGRFVAAYQQSGASIPGGARPDYKWISWDVTTGKETSKKPSEVGTWRGIRALSPDGKTIASLPDDVHDAAYDSLPVRIADAKTKRTRRHITVPRGSVDASLFWMTDGKTLAVTVASGNPQGTSLYLVSTKDGSIVRRIDLGDATTHVALSRNGKWIIALDGTDVKFWDPVTGTARTMTGPVGEGIFAVDWVELPTSMARAQAAVGLDTR